MTFEKPLSMLYNWRGSRALCDHSFIYDIQKNLTVNISKDFVEPHEISIFLNKTVVPS